MKHLRMPMLAVVAAVLLAAVSAFAEPKHIYLTYSDAPETTIDINIILPQRAPVVNVYYDVRSRDGEPKSYKNHVVAEYRQTLMEISDRRTLYVAKLTGLKPGETYHFVAGEEEYGLSKERKFRTLKGGDAPIRIVNGGDMGVDGLVIPLLTLAGRQDPDFGVIGGDIAYVNGLLAGNETWDKWLENWDQLMVTPKGHMIPIVTAIGNHETNRYDSTDNEMRCPWYTGLFGRQGEQIYYSRQFGDNLILYCLDSGHINPHDGAQAAWLRQEMERTKNIKYKFAAYHVPLYPAHRAFDGAGSKLGRTHWGPIFDEFGLTVGLEHHDHVFKRTKPLKGGQVVEKGTIYIGDGCFGRGPRTIDPQPRAYNEKEKSAAHFWVIDVKKREIDFKAIDDKGETIDAFTIKP